MAGTRDDFGTDETLHGDAAPPRRSGASELLTLHGPPASPPGVGDQPTLLGHPPTAPAPERPPVDLAALGASGLSQRERALQLTRYRLLRRLGAGGMGVVYLAHDPSLDREVAIKLLRAAPGDDPVDEAHARLLREAQALAKLSHPNVVTVHDVGTYDADVLTTLRLGPGRTDPVPRSGGRGPMGVFLVMEYVPGLTLAQWLDVRPRPIREVLEVLLAAGRGLVAAHAVGVIHRDFKPGNVLVGETGRVCVFDFGLARAAGEVEPSIQGFSAPIDPLSSSQLSAPLTRVGSLVGTPAYMAPEQRGGVAVDERADQFSFCVALYEGLYGNRPFSGDNIFALEEAKASGRIDPPRRKVRVPQVIHRALLRGLSPDPEARWPSMGDLLAAIERPLRRDRRRLLLAGGLALATAAAAVAVTRAADDAALCSGAAEALAPTWGPPQREALAAAFAATGLAYAPDAAARARERLDAYAAAWIAGHTDACEATNVRGEQSDDLLDRRMRCLETRRRELAALLAVLTVADASAVENARDAIESLPTPARCADLDALLAEVDPPPPALADDVAAVHDQMNAAAAEGAAGHLAAATALAVAAEERSRAIDYRPLRARVLADLASIQLEASDYEAGQRNYSEAFWEALATRQDHRAFLAAVALARHVGDILARPDDAQPWLRTAEALLDRLGRPAERTADLEHLRGVLAEQRTENQAAIDHYRRALELSPDDPRRDDWAANLATVHMYLGQLDIAHAMFEELLARQRETHGPEHPKVASRLTSLGNVATLRGDFDAAERHQRAALALLRRALPPHHERLAFSLSSLADLAMQRGEFAAALEAFDEARAIWERNLGVDHPRVAAMLERLASIEVMRGEFGRAEQHATRALAIWGAAQSPDQQGILLAHLDLAQLARARGDFAAMRAHVDVALPTAAAAFGESHLYTAVARAFRGHALLGQGDVTGAERDVEAAVAAIEATYGKDSVWLSEVIDARTDIRRAQGRLADARADLERVLAVVDARSAPLQRAKLEFLLGQVLWDMNDDRGRARALAEAALAAFERVGAAPDVQKIRAWLAAR